MKKNTFLLIVFLSITKMIYCQGEKTEIIVYVLGTTHSNHLVSDFEYTLKDVENIIEKINPDLICIEMTTDALDSDFEGYYPPENSAIIEFAKSNNISISTIDWRYNLFEEQKPQSISEDVKKRIKLTKNKVDRLAINYLTQNNWENYFEFIQNNNDFHLAIKEQHDTKIELLGEESDGYWITRNNKIVENLVKSINDNNAKTILVTIGLHHKYIIEELIASKPSIRIKELPNYETSENAKVNAEVIIRWQKNQNNLNELLNNDSIPNSIKNKINQSRRIKELDDFINSEGIANKKIRHLFK